MKDFLLKLRESIGIFIKRIYITVKLYLKHGLANHAAACAYGFLLSIAPMLLLIAYLIFLFFRPSPEAIISFISTIPFLGTMFDEQWLLSDVFSFSGPVIPTIVFIISITWAGRILALSIQRGLKIIFLAVKGRNPLKETLVSFAIEGSVIFLVLIILVSSRTALRLYRMFDFMPQASIIKYIVTGGQFFNIFLLGLSSFTAYILVPVNPPRKSSAFFGSLLCGISYLCIAFAFNFILDKTRYNFLYGTIGNIIIILVNVYFFFIFFFIGAQFAYVRDYVILEMSDEKFIVKS